MRDRWTALLDDVRDWCEGRSAPVRAPLLLYMAYVGMRHLLDTDYGSLLAPLNLGIHEGGHLAFGWLGWRFLTVAAGTLAQLAAPVAAGVMFARQPDWFAACFSGTWLATNLYNVATYAADAREMDLPLVTVGDGECVDTCHDWNYMLQALHLLPFDTTIAALLRLLAFGVEWASVAAGAWMLLAMLRSRRS